MLEWLKRNENILQHVGHEKTLLRGAKLLILLERAMGIEPTTYSLGSCRSTTELRPRNQYVGRLTHPT